MSELTLVAYVFVDVIGFPVCGTARQNCQIIAEAKRSRLSVRAEHHRRVSQTARMGQSTSQYRTSFLDWCTIFRRRSVNARACLYD